MLQYQNTEPLIMQEPLSKQKPSLQYEAVEHEGECTLDSITPICFLKVRYALVVLVCVLLAGIPVLFLFWYPQLQKYLFYQECEVEESTHFYVVNHDRFITIVEKKTMIVQHEGREEQYFVNRYLKYLVRENTVKVSVFDPLPKLIQSLTKLPSGLNPAEVDALRQSHGIGTMVIEKPTISQLLLREVIQPLYIFIIASIVVWMIDNYIYYCAIIFVTGAVGVITNLYQTNQTNKKICELAYYETEVAVLREDEVLRLSSKDVVPGDIVFFRQPIKVPFDAVILDGSCLVNECALTGESVPVVKKADTVDNVKKGSKSNQIFEGTTFVQIDLKRKMRLYEKYREEFGMPVLVIRTNFVTMKGQLIRIISFPNQRPNIFEKESKSFLVFLFFLATISYSALIIKLRNEIDPGDIIIKFFDLITITVPPGLPISMTFGIIYAVEKMKKKDIFCISPNKVISGGLVDKICFDKTGTLTEDYMDFYCLVPVQDGIFRESIDNTSVGMVRQPIEKTIMKNRYIERALTNMAANHSIVNVDATGENVGDPMEIKLFQFGEFSFASYHSEEEALFGFDSKRGHRGVILRRLDFDSELLRMSVVAKSNLTLDQLYIYSKGSPQAMLNLFKPSTIPKDFHQTLKQYAALGFRVLAIGSRRLHAEQLHEDRKQLEQGLQFDGFEVFENRLKPETKEALHELTRAEIPCVMITGDNPLTGSNISFKCGIADPYKKMYICDVKEKILTCQEFKYTPSQEERQAQLELREEGEKAIELQMLENLSEEHREADQEFHGLEAEIDQLIRKMEREGQEGQLCLTGPAFNYLFPGELPETIDQLRQKLLLKTKVYSRAKPNDKARIIMAYQNSGRTVGMCGDGANDCGALKQADVGLSLSPTEASISAPFTSKVTNIQSMVELIKECRAGLVTNFSLFNIMVMYSLIQYTTSIICQFYFTYPSDFQFLYWDMACNFFFFMTFGYTPTEGVLSKKTPQRSLFTLSNVIQILAMNVIQLVGQIVMIVSMVTIFASDINYEETGTEEVNYRKYKESGDQFVLDTPQANILFLFTNFMYIFSLLAASISRPWRKEFWNNLPFMGIMAVVLPYSILIVIVPVTRLSLFQISFMNSTSLNVYILCMGLLFSAIMYFNQKCLMEPLSYKLRQRYKHIKWL